MTAEGFAEVLSVLRSALARNLSPYEIGQLYKDGVAVSPSTIYRWVERGYGGMANIELERKVGFRPRRQVEPQRATRHGKERSYEAFCALDQDEQDGCCEMDTVMGLKTDTKCLLTLYLRPAHFQLVVLLEKKRINEVVRVFDMIEAMSRILFTALFSVILTDNGCEFEDPEALERSAISGMPSRCRVFYCDPRQSQQKGRCEKNHSELRQLLPKGRSSLDPLTQADIADINCKLNSTPRKSLLGRSPIESLVDAYGCRATEFMDAFSIDCLEPDDIDLNPLNTLGDDPDGIPF
jgi:IS30 family transposase